MNDPRKILLTALTTSLETATELPVYTKIPKQSAMIYPYVHIADVYMQENGSKLSYQYEYNILIEICYKDATSDGELYDKMDAVCGIVNNAVPFSLTGGFSVMDIRLNNSVKTEIMTDTGVIDVGAIRLIIRVQ
jgi:hypothetical protein